MNTANKKCTTPLQNKKRATSDLQFRQCMTKTKNNINLSLSASIKTEIENFLLNYLLATQLKSEACNQTILIQKLKRNFTN